MSSSSSPITTKTALLLHSSSSSLWTQSRKPNEKADRSNPAEAGRVVVSKIQVENLRGHHTSLARQSRRPVNLAGNGASPLLGKNDEREKEKRG